MPRPTKDNRNYNIIANVVRASQRFLQTMGNLMKIIRHETHVELKPERLASCWWRFLERRFDERPEGTDANIRLCLQYDPFLQKLASRPEPDLRLMRLRMWHNAKIMAHERDIERVLRARQ